MLGNLWNTFTPSNITLLTQFLPIIHYKSFPKYFLLLYALYSNDNSSPWFQGPELSPGWSLQYRNPFGPMLACLLNLLFSTVSFIQNLSLNLSLKIIQIWVAGAWETGEGKDGKEPNCSNKINILCCFIQIVDLNKKHEDF